MSSCGSGCPQREEQKARYKAIVEAYLEIVPRHRRGAITVWGILDTDTWLLGIEPIPSWPLLWDGNGRKKPSYDGFKEALR